MTPAQIAAEARNLILALKALADEAAMAQQLVAEEYLRDACESCEDAIRGLGEQP
jgi:hypothetical protein